MIVALLFLVVAGALLTTFLTGRTSYLSSDAFVLVQQEARRAFDVMVRELREACASGPCAATPTNQAITGSNSQLNFQVAQGYNQAACPNAICWGSEDAANPWIHYALVDADGSAATGNDRQLVRCVNNNAAGNIVSAAGCRVLANYVQTVTFDADSIDPVKLPIVKIDLQIRYANPALPTGGIGQPVALTTSVKLRNP